MSGSQDFKVSQNSDDFTVLDLDNATAPHDSDSTGAQKENESHRNQSTKMELPKEHVGTNSSVTTETESFANPTQRMRREESPKYSQEKMAPAKLPRTNIPIQMHFPTGYC